MASCIVLWIIAISGVGEYTVLTDKLPDSGDDGLEASLLLGSLLASYSVVISLWEDVWVFAIRTVIVSVIVTGKYFTLGGCCSTTALTSLLVVWIEIPWAVDGPQVCLHHCESCPHWSWYQSLSQRIFLFGRVCRSKKLQYFLQYFRLLYCLFHFGRVYTVWE